eukprot:4405580-Pyramimonas_sp.AAC.1
MNIYASISPSIRNDCSTRSIWFIGATPTFFSAPSCTKQSINTCKEGSAVIKILTVSLLWAVCTLANGYFCETSGRLSADTSWRHAASLPALAAPTDWPASVHPSVRPTKHAREMVPVWAMSSSFCRARRS